MLGITRFTSRDNRKLKKISQYIAILLQISEPILRDFSSVIRFAYEWNALDLLCADHIFALENNAIKLTT